MDQPSAARSATSSATESRSGDHFDARPIKRREFTITIHYPSSVVEEQAICSGVWLGMMSENIRLWNREGDAKGERVAVG
jgi:hypothetical protein